MNRTICQSFRLNLVVIKIAIAATLAFAAAYVLPLAFSGLSRVASAAEAVEVWWPTSGATIEGTQPFKAVLKDRPLSSYSMTWSVDSGAPVSMYDSQVDHPHKEASVDISGWNWSSTGSYSLTFIAKDATGAEIARNTVSITNKPQQAAPTAPVAVVVSAPVPTQPSSTSIAPATTVSAPKTVTTTTTRIAKVTYPLVGARLTGTQPLKAIVIGLPLSAYKMYWSIDGGAESELYDSSVGGLHKEAMIDFTTWTWKGSSPYIIKVVARDQGGALIAKSSVLIYTTANTVTAPTPIPIQPVTTTPVASPTPAPTVASQLYVDPNNPAISQANAWRTSRPADAAIMDKIGTKSSGIWLGGWNADVESDVRNASTKAESQGQIATLIAYNIPGRDCGQHSAGGLSGRDAYLSWIRKIASGIGSRSAIVVLEPDAITLTDCLSETGKTERYSMLSAAIDILAANAKTKVYVDAGHAQWLSTNEVASRLNKAGVSKAAGFALNTSNFVETDKNITYGTEVSKLIGNKRFVVDTSRNGLGSNGEWCNPSGRALGQAPTLSTGHGLVDAFIWAKKPGESDGNCNGGPSAGSWWPEYALELAKRAGY